MSDLPAVSRRQSWSSTTKDALGTASAKIAEAGQWTGSAAKAALETVAGGAATSSARAVAGGATVTTDTVRRGTVVTVNAIQGLTASGLSEQVGLFVQQLVKGGATVYDRAMDAKYLDPMLRPYMGGSYHRLFDGGHTIWGAVQAARTAVPEDTLVEQTRGVVQALLKDASTPRGLPLVTWNKATFDTVAARLEATAGIPKA